MPVSRLVSVMVQHQEMLGNRYSMCGLVPINNSLQQRDFLTAGAMPSEDHGHPQYGAYTIDALQKGVQKLGKQLHYLNTKSGFKSRAKRLGWIIRSRKPALIVIGQRPGPQKGTWHCIARPRIGNTFVFIDSDCYHYFPSREHLLSIFSSATMMCIL
ncbi:Hypothetical protein PHPALM_17998 [Phytophthora palmivora]|uniref:Uncharacterized protein n=1 Tax=Phytophthora palmivora TaxID=4796 RepID=A0A2P4XKU4_9STRA|nr:Hypothetical protein PHPALM_17998 [Phytophthora palmivora]